VIDSIAVSYERKIKSEIGLNFFFYYYMTNALISTMDMAELNKTITDLFPQIGITSRYIGLGKGEAQGTSSLVVGYDLESGYRLERGSVDFPATNLVPVRAGICSFRKSYFIKPLHYKDIFLGHILYQIGP